MHYKGNKPCPCCGKSGTESVRYSADEICTNCRRVYEKGVKAIAQSEQDTDTYIYVNFYPASCGDYNVTEKAYQSFIDMLKILNYPNATYSRSENHGYHNPNHKHTLILKENIYNQAVIVFDYIEKAIRNAQEKGKENGASLLRQLASGDITSTKFDEYSVAKKY